MNKLITNPYFADNLRRIREASGLTQIKVSIELGLLGSPLTRNAYSMIENGKRNIYVSDLVALQKIFKVDYAEFFKGIPTSR